MESSLEWRTEMQFECHTRGIKTFLDASVEHGGHDAGPNPKELILNAMMGCTAMDVISMLVKMRQKPNRFLMNIRAEKSEVPPVYFKKAKMNYFLYGDLENEKVLKAVQASMEKYCGVNFMISLSCEISYEVFLNDVSIGLGHPQFPQNHLHESRPS